MNKNILNVLFLCTGNSARSILAESILNREGQGAFAAFSAGSEPTGRIHPVARALLKRRGFPMENLRSKSWDEFAADGAPELDLVITVCDNAANEVCPIWPGHAPLTAHWGLPDPAAQRNAVMEQMLAFVQTFERLSVRIDALIHLHAEFLKRESQDQVALQQRLDEIGRL